LTGNGCRRWRQILPVSPESLVLLRPRQVVERLQPVDVGLHKPAVLDRQDAQLAQLGEPVADRALARGELARQRVLARPAVVVLPRVADQHRVQHLAADRDVGTVQDHVRDLGEAALEPTLAEP